MSILHEQSAFTHCGVRIRYLREEPSGVIGLQLFPTETEVRTVPPRDKFRTLVGWEKDASYLQPLAGLCLAEDPSPDGFTQGRTLQAGLAGRSLAWEAQEERPFPGGRDIVTRLRHTQRQLLCTHTLRCHDNCGALESFTELTNDGAEPVTLLLLTSFSLAGISPYAADDEPNRLALHRFRSSWSQEGRHVTDAFEPLHLEPSWTHFNLLSERFGQAGSMPVRGFAPLAAIADTKEGVLWGAQLAWPGSWQMEALRLGDQAALAGGLADWELGHWLKCLAPGEIFRAPAAQLATVKGSVDDLCDRFLSLQRRLAHPEPAAERDLPVLFNEFCTTWGRPSAENVLALAQRLRGSPVKYLVIDGGWSQGGNGDWEIRGDRFPDGFAALNRQIRELGMIPGIWMEFETCTKESRAFGMTEYLLHRFGRVIETSGRRFWDFRQPEVAELLAGRVIEFLRREGFGYLKVDYNETIGLGCDGDESPGEGLRRHLEGVIAFFRRIRRELPDLVIENCASGGHRLEPLLVGLSSMSSFSDAHEEPEIPLIAANLQRLMPPEKSQIWAVLRTGDSRQRLGYTLAAGFLGRLCLSGEIHQLTAEQWDMVMAAMNLYGRVWPVIRDGVSRRFGDLPTSMRHPAGAQAVRRIAADGRAALVVWHAFAGSSPQILRVSMPGRGWQIAGRFDDGAAVVTLARGRLTLAPAAPFSGGVLHLTRATTPETRTGLTTNHLDRADLTDLTDLTDPLTP